ncbi:hypothetical protein KC19_3G166700 [Ceratodon purpureus]|uniref:non-specific serine/threonine protein kinase n=1 Tax=Ceratodon purpureus TaxID=3225 RepID=A0A8T0ILU6_CERPU|nr:hypothetical protein KC19_3G166700 [Ceratodon purpureus]
MLVPVMTILQLSFAFAATKINVRNGCPYDVAACDNQAYGSKVTCYALQSDTSREKDVGVSWTAGLVWGFPSDNSDPVGNTAKLQVNYAEFCINCGSQDYYDLSNVNAYNLPLMILSSNTQCASLNCTIPNLSSFCQAPNVLSGTPGMGCLNTDGNGTVPTNGTKPFKEKCPTSYSYSKDDAGSAVIPCKTGSDYEVVFCPTSNQTYNSTSDQPSLSPSPSPSPSRSNQTTSPTPSTPSPASPTPSRSNRTISPSPSNQTINHSTSFSGWKLGISIASGVFLFIVSCLVCILVVRRRFFQSMNLDKDEECAFLESLPGLPPRFSCKDLDVATNHFSKILGEGGFGTVYEGALPDGSKVAVKRLGASRQGQKEFRAEVATIGGINHLRLVRLWGFCSEGADRMLVYEFMKNGSLDRWLFRDTVLDWAVRYQIATDTAQGLCYLHRDCRFKIIHLDVKPQNILLDHQFRAKVADFGMSKLFDREMTEVETRTRGTPGYMAPECLLQTAITVKCDVYSYGMVLLELVSGRKNLDMNNAAIEKLYFPAWAAEQMQRQSWSDISDVRLNGDLSAEDWEQVRRVVKIAMWCIQDNPRSRPSMGKVVQMLEGLVDVNDPPLQFDFLKFVADQPASSICTSNANVSSLSRRKSQKESYCQPDSELSLTPR